MLNPKFRQAYAIAKAIPRRANKRAAILAWIVAARKAINANKKELVNES